VRLVAAAEFFLEKGAARKSVAILSFATASSRSKAPKIKEFFEELKSKFSPDLILHSHARSLHQDIHRIINQLTWNTCAIHLILEFEIPKYDGDLGAPNFLSCLSTRKTCDRQDQVPDDLFQTQRGQSKLVSEGHF